MSRRLDTTECSRSASASMVLLNDWTSDAGHSTSALSRLVAAALMLASGVRRSCETAASSASRRLFASASAAADAASVWSRKRGLDELQLRDEGAQQPAVLGASARPAHDEHRAVHELGRVAHASSGVDGAGSPATRRGSASRRSSVRARRRRRGPGVRRSSVDEPVLRLVVEGGGDRRELGERLDLGLAPRQLRAAARRGGRRARSPARRPRRTRRGPARPRRARTEGCASARCRTSRRAGTPPATRRSPGPGHPAPRPPTGRAGAASSVPGTPIASRSGMEREDDERDADDRAEPGDAIPRWTRGRPLGRSGAVARRGAAAPALSSPR